MIPLFQFGFKAGHEADMQCSSMAATLMRNKAEKMNTGVLAFDIANAFPSLWPAGLEWRMQQCNFPAYLTRIVANFLVERSMLVRAFGCLSTPRMTSAGSPQGSCISPIIYNIFTADVPRDRNIQICIPVHGRHSGLGGKQAQGMPCKTTYWVLQYADGIVR